MTFGAKLATTGAIALLSAAVAADVLTDFEVERRDVEGALESLLVYGSAWAPVTDRLRELAPAKRAAAVNALGTVVREIAASAAFQRAYAERRKDRVPREPRPARDGAQLAREQQAELERSLKESEAALKNLPKDQQEAMRKALAQTRETYARNTPPPELFAQQDAERYRREKALYDEAVRRHPADVAGALRLRLGELLAATDGVDFQAKLAERHGRRVFADAKYEERPAEWKMCFRAGREACEAARAFARAWLAELK